ncbi:MAG: hypothetical protein R3B90_10715 [Planctomycetaceae bacterium]
MKLRRIAELSALVTLYADDIASCDRPIANGCLQPYLFHSREQQCLWRGQFRQLKVVQSLAPRRFALGCQQLLEELLVSELLCRVWTAVMAASDQQCQQVHAEPIARHVLVGVLEQRIELLRFMVSEAAVPLGGMLQADRLRRRCERWTDLLIGVMANRHDVLEFAVDRDRAQEFAENHREESGTSARLAWQLIARGIRIAVPETTIAAVHQPAYEGVIAAILSAIPGDAFNSNGEFHTRWVRRIAAIEPPHRCPTPGTNVDRFIEWLPTAADDDAQISFRQLFRHLGLDDC